MTDTRDLDLTPSTRFVDRLEHDLLADLGFAPEAHRPDGDARSVSEVAVHATVRARPRWSSSWLMLAATACVAVVFVAIASVIVVRHRSPALHSSTVPTASVGEPTTTAPPATSTIPAPPNGQLPAGTYAVRQFAVPFTFTSTGTWTHDRSRHGLVDLNRGTTPRMAITAGVFDGATPDDVIAGICPGALDASPASDTVLLDHPALRVVARVTVDCTLVLAPDVTTVVFVGDVLEITVADVDGTIVVVTASAVSSVWPSAADEVDALIASLHPIDPPTP